MHNQARVLAGVTNQALALVDNSDEEEEPSATTVGEGLIKYY